MDGWSVMEMRGFFAGMVHHKPIKCSTARAYAAPENRSSRREAGTVPG
jgi:hypothetical protein